jgi:hypothetical protein
MIILYVPFQQNNAGDLSEGVFKWKENHLRHFKEEITILYHGSNIEIKQPSSDTQVYVCIHGSDNSSLLSNNSDFSKGNLITIREVAGRFDYDFLHMMSEIKKIHLYCCGSKEKNTQLALSFQQHILRAEHSSIISYSGYISILTARGLQTSTSNQQEVPVEDVQNIFNSIEKELDQHSSRSTVKRPGPKNYIFKPKTACTFFEKMKATRLLRFENARQRQFDAIGQPDKTSFATL